MPDVKRYTILLEGQVLGTTLFEKADAPMGVVFGMMDCPGIGSLYAFFKGYCQRHNLPFEDMPEVGVIHIQDIPNLRVVAANGVEIKGVACTVSGMDSEGFQIDILGVPYPFYAEEFPHHVHAYDQQFPEC